jgi:hypothetical protein
MWLNYQPEDNLIVLNITDRDLTTQRSYVLRQLPFAGGLDILKLFNFPISRAAEFFDLVGVPHNGPFLFPNVRSRQTGDIFLHASFVSNSTAGYLGRDPEFYTKPSKMYPDDGQNFFYIETSLDGYNRISLPYENFIVELTYIIDADDYQSP